MKVWVRLIKHFRGGSRDDYKFVELSNIDTPKKQELFMENWGEYTSGGHIYGYHVEMYILEENEYPPLEWIETRLLSNENVINSLKLRINEINELNNELLNIRKYARKKDIIKTSN